MTILFAVANFVERLLPIEREYFLWLNHQRSDFLDSFMSIYSDKLTWLPLAIVLLVVIVRSMKWREALLLILCGVLIGLLCDYVAAEFIKPFFARLRPSHHPDFKEFVGLVDGRRGGRFGFISNHASNGFGIAMFTSLIFRYKAYSLTIFSWVIITAYSRIYLGVHFITDIMGGMFWGMIVGFGVYMFYQFCRKKYLYVPKDELHKAVLPKIDVQMLMLTILFTILCILVYSLILPFSE